MSSILFFKSAIVGRELLRFCRAVVKSDGSVTLSSAFRLGVLICGGVKSKKGILFAASTTVLIALLIPLTSFWMAVLN